MAVLYRQNLETDASYYVNHCDSVSYVRITGVGAICTSNPLVGSHLMDGVARAKLEKAVVVWQYVNSAEIQLRYGDFLRIYYTNWKGKKFEAIMLSKGEAIVNLMRVLRADNNGKLPFLIGESVANPTETDYSDYLMFSAAYLFEACPCRSSFGP